MVVLSILIRLSLPSYLLRGFSSMAPHLAAAELDSMQKLHEKGKAPMEVHASLAAHRRKTKQKAPHLTKVRKALKGQTYRRAAVETRGRKKSLSRHMVFKMDAARKKLLKRKQGLAEVRWADVVRAARAPKVHRSTAKRVFHREGIPVAAAFPFSLPCTSVSCV